MALSFEAITQSAEAIGGILIYYVAFETSEKRVKKIQKAFKGLAYVMFACFVFLLFKNTLTQVSQELAGFILISLVIGAIVGFYLISQALIVEAEIAATILTKKLEKKLKKR